MVHIFADSLLHSVFNQNLANERLWFRNELLLQIQNSDYADFGYM